MPVTTRSQSQRQCRPSKRVRESPSRKSIKSPVVLKKRRRPKKSISSSLKPQKRPRMHQSLDRSEQSQITTGVSSPVVSDSTITHWSCQTCSCPLGIFDYPVNSCIRCGHKMERHENMDSGWDPRCGYLCKREKLVTSIMRMLDSMRVIVIRSTPQAGKSVLLQLLGQHVLQERRELEPIFINWRTQEQRKNLPYPLYLKQQETYWRERNVGYRPCNPEAKTLYLIDEAQQSYEDQDFWTKELKNPFTRSQPLFVLVCLYGAEVSMGRSSTTQSMSLSISPFQRIELRSSGIKNPSILFTLDETTIVVQKWAMFNQFELANNVCEYLHLATDGHPGMVGFVLRHFDNCVWKSSEATRLSTLWTPERCHAILIDHDDLIHELTRQGRGLWTLAAEVHIKQFLKRAHFLNPRFMKIKFFDVVDALRQVATRPHGYTPDSSDDSEYDFLVFEFCHHMGFLYTQQTWPASDQITYTFASPIHQRVAYRRLCPGPNADSASHELTLQKTCLNAIERFSPSALQHRSMLARDCGGVPEAAYQDEMYCALNFELHNLPILSEYSHTKDGRIDFFISDKKWGIEILRCGSVSKIWEHAARFAIGGKYREWDILSDYIVLHFCSRSTVRELEIQDVEVQSRILQVVIDSNECTAEVYSYDKKLLVTLALGEGRQRLDNDDAATGGSGAGALKFMQERILRLKEEAEDTARQMERIEKRNKHQ